MPEFKPEQPKEISPTPKQSLGPVELTRRNAVGNPLTPSEIDPLAVNQSLIDDARNREVEGEREREGKEMQIKQQAAKKQKAQESKI